MAAWTARDNETNITLKVRALLYKLRPSETPTTLIAICKDLITVFTQNPKTINLVYTDHFLMPIVDLLGNSRDQIVILGIMSVLNKCIFGNIILQETLCILGGIPTVIKYHSVEYSREIRHEVIIFINSLCLFKNTLQMFVCCRGMPVLVEYFKEHSDFQLVGIAADCILKTLELAVYFI